VQGVVGGGAVAAPGGVGAVGRVDRAAGPARGPSGDPAADAAPAGGD
jgi:hypothetical protein